jgi:hypothetical protein
MGAELIPANALAWLGSSVILVMIEDINPEALIAPSSPAIMTTTSASSQPPTPSASNPGSSAGGSLAPTAPGAPPPAPIDPAAQAATTPFSINTLEPSLRFNSRDWIALGVLVLSIGAVFILSVSTIGSADKNKSKVSSDVMSATLPLYGTWVGTILAFYFSRSAFDAASSATTRNIEAASNATTRNVATLQQIASGSAAAPPPPENVLAKISVKSLANNLLFSQKDPTKLLKDVLAELQAADRYRVIVVDATTKKFIGLVHRRTAEAYLATPEQVGSNPAASSAPTLQTYLDWLNGSGAAAKPTVVFLAETASLADVDAKLKETKGKDAIVTSDGTPDSPVIVYINDNDINEYRTT